MSMRVALAGLVVLGIAIRVALLPTPGYVGDIDQFIAWVRHIATSGLAHAYDETLSFGPVMAFVWWILGSVEPAFRTATDSSAVDQRILMKLPATLADLGLAAGAWVALRARPRWAVIAVGVILLHPAIWFVSAWWGQYESIFTLAVLLAYLLAIRGRHVLAAVALAAALMTKPQVVPVLIPFAAWFLSAAAARSVESGSQRPRRLASILRPAGIAHLAGIAGAGLATIALLWLPFVAAGGPGDYLAGLARYQGELYSVLSLNAWNLWWLVQQVAAGGAFISDAAPFVGPLSFRVLGYVITGWLLFLVALGVWRSPTPRTLALGIAAAAIVAFTFLTTMHERYAYAALPFLALTIEDRRVRWLGAAFGIVYTVNLVASAPQYLGGLLTPGGPLGIAGSVAMLVLALLLVREVLRGRTETPTPDGSTPDGRTAPALNAPVSGGRTPRGTSAGSAGAIFGA